MQTHSIREQLEKLSGKAIGSAAESIEGFKKKLKTLAGEPGEAARGTEEVTLKSVNDAANTLYGDVDKADAAPTLAQIEATAAAERDAVLVRTGCVHRPGVPAMNRWASLGFPYGKLVAPQL